MTAISMGAPFCNPHSAYLLLRCVACEAFPVAMITTLECACYQSPYSTNIDKGSTEAHSNKRICSSAYTLACMCTTSSTDHRASRTQGMKANSQSLWELSSLVDRKYVDVATGPGSSLE